MTESASNQPNTAAAHADQEELFDAGSRRKPGHPNQYRSLTHFGNTDIERLISTLPPDTPLALEYAQRYEHALRNLTGNKDTPLDQLRHRLPVEQEADVKAFVYQSLRVDLYRNHMLAVDDVREHFADDARHLANVAALARLGQRIEQHRAARGQTDQSAAAVIERKLKQVSA